MADHADRRAESGRGFGIFTASLGRVEEWFVGFDIAGFIDGR